jgi:methylthioribose-1-phosphate isomerase
MYTPAVIFENDKFTIIDQTLLPDRFEYIPITSITDCLEAIKILRVRGAPAIGICAAYGLYIAAKSSAIYFIIAVRRLLISAGP